MERHLIEHPLPSRALAARARGAYRPWTGAATRGQRSWAPTRSRRAIPRRADAADDPSLVARRTLNNRAAAFGRAAQRVKMDHVASPRRSREAASLAGVVALNTRTGSDLRGSLFALGPRPQTGEFAARGYGPAEARLWTAAFSRRFHPGPAADGDLVARPDQSATWYSARADMGRAEARESPLRRAAITVGSRESRRRAIAPMTAAPDGSALRDARPVASEPFVSHSRALTNATDGGTGRQFPSQSFSGQGPANARDLDRTTSATSPWESRRGGLDLARWIDRHIADAVRSNGLGTTGPDPRISPPLPGSAPYA